jgi:hypothetical protein
MRPVESLVVREIPVRRVERVTLLATGETLHDLASFEVHQEGRLDDDALGELVIRTPKPKNALIDVVAIDFAASLPSGPLDRLDAP